MTVDSTDDIQLATAMLNQAFSVATALVLIFPRESGYSLLSDAPGTKTIAPKPSETSMASPPHEGRNTSSGWSGAFDPR
ncbi:hypothetical protein ACWEQ2_39355 [Streptomyces sp. NPDC004096]|uniref:hypothetical protein n=1 Tax=Streptomyces sp. NPDC057746 TaxID=3346237 RepID=UPI00367E2D6C